MSDRRLTWRGAAALATASGLLGLAVVTVSPRPPGQDRPAAPPAEATPVVIRFDYAARGCTTSSRESLVLECGDAWEGAIIDFRRSPPMVSRWRVETGPAGLRPLPTVGPAQRRAP